MLNRITAALLTATVCSSIQVLADPLHTVYLEKYGGTYSTDCDDAQANRLSILADKLVFTSSDDEVVAEDILTNVSYWGRMPPEGFELAMIAGFKANGLVFLIHSDEHGFYILLEEDTTSDEETRYYKCK